MKYSYIDKRIKKISIEDWYKDADYFKELNLINIFENTAHQRWWQEKNFPYAGKSYYINIDI